MSVAPATKSHDLKVGIANQHETNPATSWPVRILGSALLVWYLVLAIGAGYLGTGLNCEDDDCKTGFPSWLQPWTWGDYYVHPEAFYAALAGLVPAAALVYWALTGRRLAALVAFLVSLVPLSYAFFGGLTPDGRVLLGVTGAILAGATLIAAPDRAASEAFRERP